MKYIKYFEHYRPLVPTPYRDKGRETFQDQKNLDRDSERFSKEIADSAERRNNPANIMSYNPKTGRGWTPETLIDYAKERYGVEVPKETYLDAEGKYDEKRPWDAIGKIKRFLATAKATIKY